MQIWKREIYRIEGTFPLVTMLDSLEHMPAQLSVLQAARRLIGASGRILVRIPVIAFAWREYREDWVQLDPPRHLFLHTRRSLKHLAEQAGLSVTDVIDDSNSFQFWGSEQYRRGIPLMSSQSLFTNPNASLFTPAQIAEFDRHAEALKATGDGDTACFFLKTACL